MNERHATIAPNLDVETVCEAATFVANTRLSSPTIVRGANRSDGAFVYGLVARVALSRPGFGFRVEHDLPFGVDLVETRPRATVVGNHLIWQLGRIDPGHEVRLEVVVHKQDGVQLDPSQMADFSATYSQNLYFEAPVVRPRLTVRMSGPAAANRGSTIEFVLDVANIGSWVAEEVRTTIALPTELEHPEGPNFAFLLGDLNPGEFRRLTIPARTVNHGKTTVRAEISGRDGRQAVVEFLTQVR